VRKTIAQSTDFLIFFASHSPFLFPFRFKSRITISTGSSWISIHAFSAVTALPQIQYSLSLSTEAMAALVTAMSSTIYTFFLLMLYQNQAAGKILVNRAIRLLQINPLQA